MEAYNTHVYPVFEADQVLSQKDLNTVVSHLEEQDRITRKNLTGIGIICGLELSFPTDDTIKISCGTAVTSLGFQINWKETVLTHYRDYELSDQFLKPDYTREPHLDPIFKYAPLYEPIKSCTELLAAGVSDTTKKPITKDFLEDKLVILLLEVTLIDQKNCVTTNCDDKGKRMEFNVRPLVIPLGEMRSRLFREYKTQADLPALSFPRYNVPYKNIVTGADVLDQFRKVYDDSYLITLSDTIANAYADYQENFYTQPDFPVLENCRAKIAASVAGYKASVNIQYLWDWISDITQAYNEIVDFKKVNPTLCCIDERVFPFHVVLGNKTEEDSVYRTPFIRSLNAKKEEDQKIKALVLLYDRLAHIINSFRIEKGKIKITPSVYGDAPLSDKSIPYYYDEILNLNDKWNPALATKNQNDTILSYFSDIAGYTHKPAIQKPLLFDIEPYNFFRVEGHIGQNYKTALKELTLIKDSYNLPFKITALNAVDYVNKEVDIAKFDGRWDDLETDYDLARKRLYNITEFVINWMDQRKTTLASQNIISVQNIDNFKNILLQIKNLLTNDLKEFLPNFKGFYEIFKQLNYVFLFHRWCIQLGKEKLSVLAEDLIDRLDDINELFLEDPFTVIYEEAYLRWQKTYKDLFFSTFAKKYPGLEHKAGVTKGGPLVLVYVDATIFKAAAPPLYFTAILKDLTAYKDNIAIDTSIKQDLIKSVKFNDYKSQIKGKPDTSSATKCKDEADNIKANLLEVAKYNLDANYTMEMSSFILENLKDVLQYDFYVVPQQGNTFQQMVIADFFLPYTCCSDGTTLEIKFEESEPLSISLDPLKYCNDDQEGEYEIKIKGKSGGIFTGAPKGSIVQHSDKYYLRPYKLEPKVYSLQYELDGEQSNTVEFEVFSPGELKWTAERSEKEPNSYVFINPNQKDTHDYEFDFGDGDKPVTTKETKVGHEFPFNEKVHEFKVTITQLGEVCQNSQIIVVKGPADFNTPDFDSKDFYTEK